MNKETTMTEAAPPPKLTIAQQKERLRAALSAFANKVPAKVNAGSIQTTREWVKENDSVALIGNGGKKRLSRRALKNLLSKTQAWHEQISAPVSS